MFMHSTDHRLALFKAVLRFTVAVITEVSGDYVGSDALFGFGNAERAVVLLQERENIVCKPGFVTEFECCLYASGKGSDEVFQQFGIGFHIRRELEEHGTKLPCAGQGLNRAKKTWEEVFCLV